MCIIIIIIIIIIINFVPGLVQFTHTNKWTAFISVQYQSNISCLSYWSESELINMSAEGRPECNKLLNKNYIA